MAAFTKLHFSLSDDAAPGHQSRLRNLSRDSAPGGLSGLGMESAGGPRRAPPSPETAGRLYLQTFLEDAQNESLEEVTSPESAAIIPDLEVVRTSRSDPLISRAVVFQQNWRKIPVFAGRVAVDVDEGNLALVTINGKIAPRPDISPVATRSPGQAIKDAEEWAASGTIDDDAAPVLTWYMDEVWGLWHLTWHFSGVSLQPPRDGDGSGDGHDHHFCLGPSPRSRNMLIDVLIDAHTGRAVYYFSSMPHVTIPVAMTGEDIKGMTRSFFGLRTPTGFALSDPLRKIVTYDFGFQDIDANPLPSAPSKPVATPQADLGKADPTAVSAHHNASVVFNFYNDVLKRDGIDDKGMQLVSIVNVTSSKSGDADPKDWGNAVWWKGRMWYGQKASRSYAEHLDVIGHELTHGVMESTSMLVYRDLPGALNESMSDCMGVIIANWYPNEPEPVSTWNWKIGDGLGANGGPIRDFSDPAATGQPDHFSQYKKLPFSDDYGGVHIYSGIHNKAVYHLLTGEDAAGNPTFPVRDVVLLLYITLTRLTQTSDFHDSRKTLESVTRAYYSGNATIRAQRLAAIATAFGKVGL